MPLWLAMLHFVKPAMDSPISRHQVKQHHLTAIPCVSTTLAFKHKYALQQQTIQIKHSAYLLEWILQSYWKIRREIPRRCSVTICSFFSLGFSQTKFILTELLVVNHKYNLGIIFTYHTNQNYWSWWLIGVETIAKTRKHRWKGHLSMQTFHWVNRRVQRHIHELTASRS